MQDLPCDLIPITHCCIKLVYLYKAHFMFYSVYDLTPYTLNSKRKTNERYMHRLLSKEVIAYYVYRLKFDQQSERTEELCN